MKTKTILISLCLFFASAGFAHSRPFERFAEKNDVRSMLITPSVLPLPAIFSGMSGIDIDISDLISGIESMQILTTTSPARIEQMQREFSQFATANYKKLGTVTHEGSDISIFANVQGSRIQEVIMLLRSRNNFMTFLVSGDFSLQEIQQIMEMQ